MPKNIFTNTSRAPTVYNYVSAPRCIRARRENYYDRPDEKFSKARLRRTRTITSARAGAALHLTGGYNTRDVYLRLYAISQKVKSLYFSRKRHAFVFEFFHTVFFFFFLRRTRMKIASATNTDGKMFRIHTTSTPFSYASYHVTSYADVIDNDCY